MGNPASAHFFINKLLEVIALKNKKHKSGVKPFRVHTDEHHRAVEGGQTLQTFYEGNSSNCAIFC